MQARPSGEETEGKNEAAFSLEEGGNYYASKIS